MISPPARILHGHLDLVCGLDDLGRSAILRQSFRAPVHLGKAWREGEMLVVNVVNQTAGLLSGDRIDTQVRVETGGRLLLTTPSASRAHPTPDGRIALEQHFTVANGAYLDVFPEIFIPHRGTECSQKTVISLDENAKLFYIDLLAPGRVAMGESFQYCRLDWRLDIFSAGRLVVRERSILEPGSANMVALREVFPDAYYGTAYVISPDLDLERSRIQQILDLQSDRFWIGLSKLPELGIVVKMLAADSLAMRSGVQKVRKFLYQTMGVAEPGLRKI